jgi:glyoxylase-like metal-dependent hydrolase (beta-lactamase superfamily II)
MATKVRIGSAEVVALVDRMHPIDPPWHYPNVPPEAWAPYQAAVADEAYWFLNFRAFLIRADGKTVLIDTGWGPDFAPPGAPSTPASLLVELASQGVGPDDVDLVVFTHLHADHVGWNLERDGDVVRPRFQNARYLVPETDWAYFSTREENHPNIRQNALPLASLGIMDLFQPEKVILPSLRSYPTPGHSPGHTSFVLESGGERCVVLGDLVHHPVIVGEPDWVHRFDWDPAMAVATRKRELERLADEGTLVIPGHFPAPGFGHVRRAGGRFTWEFMEVRGQ